MNTLCESLIPVAWIEECVWLCKSFIDCVWVKHFPSAYSSDITYTHTFVRKRKSNSSYCKPPTHTCVRKSLLISSYCKKTHRLRCNTIIPQHLIGKLNLLGLNTSLCDGSWTSWPRDLSQSRYHTSSTTTLSTGAPQGYVLSPLLFPLLSNAWLENTSSSPMTRLWWVSSVRVTS